MGQNLFVVLIATVVFFPPNPAHAYLDAGSASMVLQVIVATLVGVAVTLKIYWGRFSVWARKFFTSKSLDEK